MFKNYLKVTLRNLLKNAFYALINIIGLGLALAICIVAYVNNKYDSNFDSQHEKGSQIYKIGFTRTVQARSQPYGITAMSLGPLVETNVSGVESVVRMATSYSPLKVGLKNFNKRIAYVDQEFFDMFTVPIISGTADNITDQNTILISEDLANIYFGDSDPVGEIMSIFNDKGKEFTYMVAGVFENLPLNSSFVFEAVTLIDNFISMWEVNEHDWRTWVAGTFIMIPEEDQVANVENMLQQFVEVANDAREDFQIDSLYLVPLPDMAHHAWDIWSNWFRQSFHPAAVTAPPLMALFILLLACFNFTNTSIALSSKRIKEIGVRKVVGGQKKQIRTQFFGENFVMSLFALTIGVAVARWLVRVYSSMWEYMDISLSFREDPMLGIFLIILILITTLMAGAYPSFYVSRFSPVLIFQDKYKLGGKNVLSLLLLGFNFLIAVNSIVSGIYFYQNADYQNNVYLGYDKEHIISVPFNDNSSFEEYKNTIKANPVIESVGESEEHISWSSYSRPIKYEDIELEVRMMDVGHGYFHTMGLNLLEGREFDPDLEQSDREGNVIVSRKLLNDFGIDDPLSKRIIMSDTVTLNIVGVMDDFYPFGVWNNIEPTMFRMASRDRLRMLTVRVQPEDLQSTNEYMEEQWNQLIPNFPYEGFFQEEQMAEAKSINKNIKNIYVFLAIIASLLSAIGLYSMVSLMVIRRTKEIGIRKVMGAEIPLIIFILGRVFIIIIAIASAIGISSGWYVSKILMGSIWDLYAEANIVTFLLPVLLVIGITVITMSGRIWEAASKNPSESLRYE